MNQSKLPMYFLLIAAVGGLAALGGMLAVPSEETAAWLFGYSKTKIFLMGSVLLGVGIFLWPLWKINRQPEWGAKGIKNLKTWLERPGIFNFGLLICSQIIIWGLYYYLLSLNHPEPLLVSRLNRLAPILLWLILLGGLGMLFLRAVRYEHSFKLPALSRADLLPYGVGLLFVLGLILFIAITRLGITRDIVGWDDFGVPITLLQVFGTWGIVVGIGVGLIALQSREEKQLSWKIDLFFGVVLWVSAILIWQATPFSKNYFAPYPPPPNAEFYPYSDAALQDQISQNVMLGNGYGEIAEKPLYSVFLTILHLVIGQDYDQIVNAQIVILALFPVGLYFLGNVAQHRMMGLFLAILVILREKNTLMLSGFIRVSHSKLLMTDLPAALLIVTFTLFCFYWLKRYPRRSLFALIAGGLLGITALMRSQVIIFAPLVLLGMALVVKRPWRKIFSMAGYFTAAFMIMLLPWIWRNYSVTGVFGYSQPQQALYISRQYSLTPGVADAGGGSELGVEDRVPEGFGSAGNFIKEYPGVVAEFISSHFLRNHISTALILPMSYFISEGVVESVSSLPFWGKWDGSIPVEARLFFIANMGFLIIGLGTAWKRHGLIGMLPLVIFWAYNFSVAIARISGWRLILPVDWVGIFYYSMGVIQVSLWGGGYFFGGKSNRQEIVQPQEMKINNEKGKIIIVVVVFIAAAILVPGIEKIFPKAYTPIDNLQAAAMLKEELASELYDSIPSPILEDPTLAVFWGTGFYPRFYLENDGLGGSGTNAFTVQDFRRLGLLLIGNGSRNILIRMQKPPDYFPNAQEMIVFGCRMENGLINAELIAVLDEPSFILLSESPCPSS